MVMSVDWLVICVAMVPVRHSVFDQQFGYSYTFGSDGVVFVARYFPKCLGCSKVGTAVRLRAASRRVWTACVLQFVLFCS